MVRHHTLGNYGEADLSPVRSWVLDRVGHQPTSWAGPSRTSENAQKPNFVELRQREVRSPSVQSPHAPANRTAQRVVA